MLFPFDIKNRHVTFDARMAGDVRYDALSGKFIYNNKLEIDKDAKFAPLAAPVTPKKNLTPKITRSILAHEYGGGALNRRFNPC